MFCYEKAGLDQKNMKLIKRIHLIFFFIAKTINIKDNTFISNSYMFLALTIREEEVSLMIIQMIKHTKVKGGNIIIQYNHFTFYAD